MSALPTGTVTFVFTDIEGSTRLLHELGERYAEVLAEHRRLLREAFARRGGVEVDTQGDAFFYAFSRASDAAAAAREAQAALADGPVRVRIGIHTGEPAITDEGYLGMDVHRAARICAVAHGGQVLLSQATRDLAGETVELRDLGEHRLKDLSAPQRLYQLGHGDFPPLRTLHQTNLPVQVTPLVGRQREVEEAARLLRQHRLVTLVGPGGTGKTRLALELAAEAVEEFAGDVSWISLAAISDPELVEPAIGRAVGASDGLIDHLRSRRALLLLDNFEHLLDAAPRVAELLRGAPDVKVLVTSRAPLRVTGEREYPVPPLPDGDAISLFVERARAVKPSFEPDDDVAEICRRLDGLPLAVELAAARVRVLTPAKIVERLGRPLAMLSGGARDAPERQRTLQATMDWSYQLLEEVEKRLFAQLAVFGGSFSVEAAEAVCDADLDTLEALVDKSLLRQTDDGRFFMLATVRQYAAERLGEGTEEGDTHRRHAEYLVALAEEAEHTLQHSLEPVWAGRLRAEYDNIAAALAWTVDGGDVALGLRLASALTRFWIERDYASEGDRWLELLLAEAERAPLAVHAKARVAAWNVTSVRGDRPRAERHAKRAHELYRQLGDDAGVAWALVALASIYEDRGEYEEAKLRLDEALPLHRAVGDELGVRRTLQLLGNIARETGNLEYARRLLRESVGLAHAVPDPFQAAGALHSLGDVELEAGQVSAAKDIYLEALETARQIGADRISCYCIGGLSAVAASQGHHAYAWQLWAAAEALEATLGFRMRAPSRTRYERRLPASPESARPSRGGLDPDSIIDAALATVELNEVS